jgi:hypothetical protein
VVVDVLVRVDLLLQHAQLVAVENDVHLLRRES